MLKTFSKIIIILNPIYFHSFLPNINEFLGSSYLLLPASGNVEDLQRSVTSLNEKVTIQKENLFLMEEIGVSRKANNWEDSIRRSIEEISGLSPHLEDSVLGEVKAIYKLFKVHLIFALNSGQGDLIKVMSNNFCDCQITVK